MLRIKQILKEQGITAKELASKLGITESGLSQAISGNGNPTIKRLEEIAKALDVPLVELFTDSRDEHTLTCQCGRKYKITPIED